MGGNKVTVERWPYGVRQRSVEHSRLYHERVLYSLDQFALLFVVYCAGEKVVQVLQLLAICILRIECNRSLTVSLLTR